MPSWRRALSKSEGLHRGPHARYYLKITQMISGEGEQRDASPRRARELPQRDFFAIFLLRAVI